MTNQVRWIGKYLGCDLKEKKPPLLLLCGTVWKRTCFSESNINLKWMYYWVIAVRTSQKESYWAVASVDKVYYPYLTFYIDREPTLRTKPSKLTIVFELYLHIDLWVWQFPSIPEVVNLTWLWASALQRKGNKSPVIALDAPGSPKLPTTNLHRTNSNDQRMMMFLQHPVARWPASCVVWVSKAVDLHSLCGRHHSCCQLPLTCNYALHGPEASTQTIKARWSSLDQVRHHHGVLCPPA
jgi:hypothetical protein